jgi:hypothetical protein
MSKCILSKAMNTKYYMSTGRRQRNKNISVIIYDPYYANKKILCQSILQFPKKTIQDG